MASCRIGRIPMPSDPVLCPLVINAFKRDFIRALLFSTTLWVSLYLKTVYPHEVFQRKGPEHPGERPRRKKFPGGGPFFGWGNNGLNRDCSIYEYECWAGYVGRKFAY